MFLCKHTPAHNYAHASLVPRLLHQKTEPGYEAMLMPHYSKSTVRIITVALIAALLACVYLPLHNLAVQMLLPSVGECCGPAKETKAACMHLDVPPSWASPAYTTRNTTVEPHYSEPLKCRHILLTDVLLQYGLQSH